MPLIHSASAKAVGQNIANEQAHGKPHAQAVAIALSEQRRMKQHHHHKPHTVNSERDDLSKVPKKKKKH